MLTWGDITLPWTGDKMFPPASGLVSTPHFRAAFELPRQVSQRRQTHGGQALIQNLPVNANAMHEKLPVSVPQIRHESTAMAAFQNPNATHDGHALRLRQSPGRAFVNDSQFSGQGTG